jgi:hypothetical protein
MSDKPKIAVVGVEPNSHVMRLLAEHFTIDTDAKFLVVIDDGKDELELTKLEDVARMIKDVIPLKRMPMPIFQPKSRQNRIHFPLKTVSKWNGYRGRRLT